MDLITGLSAVSQALGLVKDLREIDRGVDEASFKLKLAEIGSALADAKIALADAKERIAGLESELDTLKNGELCPKCRSGRMQLVSSEPHHMYGLGHLGVEDWNFVCDNSDCAFEQEKLNDPHGAIPKFASKR